MDITAVMAVHNDWPTLPRALRALGAAAREVPVQLLLCDNDSQDPGAADLASVWLVPQLIDWGFSEVRVLPSMPSSKASNREARKLENLCRLWAFFTMVVATPYMLWVDADVLIPPDGIYRLLSGMLGDSRLGVYGLDYPVSPGSAHCHDHVPNGCTLYRMSAVRELPEINHSGCQCRWIDEKLTSLGWGVRFASGLATHVE